MPDSQASTPSPQQWQRHSGDSAARGGQRRLRVALYVMLAVLSLAVLLQGLVSLRLQEAGAADSEALDHAGEHRTFIQQIGRQAALLLAEPPARQSHRAALEVLLQDAAADAVGLDGLLARQVEPAQAPGRRLEGALEAWQAARERLWYRAWGLARTGDDQPEDEWRQRAAAVQAEIGPAMDAAQRLAAAVRQVGELRGQGLRDGLGWGVAALLLLMGLLALAVVEPAARSVGRHARRLAEQAEQVRLLALVAEHTSAIVTITDADDRIQWVNAAFTQTCGWTLDEVRGRRALELLQHPEADARVDQHFREALRDGEGARHEVLRRVRSGRDVWLDIDLRPLRDEQGRLSGFVRVASDVSARVQQQAKLLALWAALPAGVVVHDEEGNIVDANREAERLLGLPMDELLGRHPVDPRWGAVREDGSPYPGAEMPALRTLRTGQALYGETLGVRRPDGQLRWLLVNSEPQRDMAGHMAGVVDCFIDITERRVLQEQLAEHARTDTLTQLPNRSVVMERLRRAIAHARRNPGYGFAVLFMDFDRFKQVNDTLGHSAGDELLRQLAERLQRCIRPGDALARVGSHVDIAARLGGDEFVVVLEGVSEVATLARIADRVQAELAEPYLIGSTPVQSGVSMGVVLSTAPGACAGMDLGEVEGRGDSGFGSIEVAHSPTSLVAIDAAAEQVLRNADTAMYEAKRAGRGRWVLFDDSMQERVVRAMALETDLRRALRDDELFVVYQPEIALASGAVLGVEALVRWRHPERGLVPPLEFIVVAEECGLIDAVGSVVLRKACQQFMHWRRTLGPLAPRMLAVNLSRAQLKRPGLVAEVRALLQELGMPPACLELEVTESLAAQDEPVQAALRELKALGTRLALDDFGTGYSSLACLHLLPVDTVKIDRSFVVHAETVEYHRVLIEATIRVARTLGMVTVAEGIETEGQAALMQRLECDRGQGYLYARPLDAAAFEDWARADAEQLTPA